MIKILSLLTISLSLSLAACAPEAVQKASPITEAAQRESYQATGLITKSLPEIAEALAKGEITSEALVQLYLTRIAKIDKNGPRLQAVLSLNPDAIAEARKLDQMRRDGHIKGVMHGIPVLLKDNIETKDNMATTAGALALKDNLTGRDSPLAADLRRNGAIILGKTNLSQWANFRSEGSMSGWSLLGGQVRNPHILDRNPCGSSAGSGAATAASLAAASVGTETDGSIICPSNANGVVGFKPTVGLVPQNFIIPISASQDTAGPMTKTVTGAAMMMNAMTHNPQEDYTRYLQTTALKNIRIGVLKYAEGHNAKIRGRFLEALTDMEQAGATLVSIDQRPRHVKGFGRMSYDVLKYEFKEGLNAYLSTVPNAVPVRSLKELIAFNIEHGDKELVLFDQSIFISSEAMTSLNDPDYISARNAIQKATREDGIDLLLKQYDVDVLIAPSGPLVPRTDPINGDVWPDFPGAASMAAIAGYPHATVPMGSVLGLPINISFMGGYGKDAKILGYAYAYEQKSKKRSVPKYYKTAESLPQIKRAMKPYDK